MNKNKNNKKNKKKSFSQVSRGLTRETKTMRFRLVDNGTSGIALNTNGSGILAGFLTADPSGGSTWTASEWSTIVALFSEVRLISMKIHFMFAPQSDSKIDGTLPGNTFYVSSILSTISSSPTTSAQVFDNADGQVFTIFSTQTRPIFKVLKPRNRLNFAVVTTPNPGSYAGCPGAIQWYADQLPASITVGYAKIEGIYEFRSRI